MELKALIFDVDGTLAETEEVHRRAFNDTFAAFGLDWHWDRALYGDLLSVAGGKERLRYYIENWQSGRADAIHVAEIHAAKTARYTSLVEAGEIALRPGVERLIHEAMHHDVALAIATTTSMPNVEALLTSTLGFRGLDLFAVVAAGDSVARKKPAADIYERALEHLGLPPWCCVAIEDSFNGVMAARCAGIPALATTSAYTRYDDLRYAFAVLSDLGEPHTPYLHISGAGAEESYVSIEVLRRWGAELLREQSEGAAYRQVAVA